MTDDRNGEPIFDKAADTERDPALVSLPSTERGVSRPHAVPAFVKWGIPLLVLVALATIFIALR